MNYMKKNLSFNIGAFILGAIFLFLALVIYNNSSLLGGGVAFTLVGLLGIFQSLKFMKTPEKCEEIELVKNEERTVFIREKTNSKLYSVFVYIESFGCFITGVLGYRTTTMVLAFLLIGKMIAWFIIGTKIANEN
ncbi:MAG TPA: hypothetical protein DIU45_19555 [Clostridium sp.]|nr:hypothetical protein [Clostridium sp.]